MPRSLSTALQTQVSAQQTKTAFLVELNLSTVIRLTDFYRDVTYDSNSYEAGGSFLSVDSTTETGQLQVDDINLGFSNVTDQVRQLVRDGSFTDKVVNVYNHLIKPTAKSAVDFHCFCGLVKISL